jgi:hypothetical protein
VCVHFPLHKLFPRSRSIQRPCVTVRNSAFLNGKQLLPLAESPCWKTTTVCWLSMTGHSVYLQLPSTSVSHIVPTAAPWWQGPTEHWIYCAVVCNCYMNIF